MTEKEITPAMIAQLQEINPDLYTLLSNIITTHVAKSHDYAITGNPFFNFEEAAKRARVDVDTVFRVMLGIKEARLITLTSEGKTPMNESIDDTYLDKAVYTLLQSAYNIFKKESK